MRYTVVSDMSQALRITQVAIRFTAQEKRQIARAAKRTTISTFCRDAILAAVAQKLSRTEAA